MLKILLVDDEPESLAALARVMRAAGHSVTLARDGLIALETARSAVPDAIVADVMMPGLNGFQLCRRLRQDPLTMHVPVFLMSGKVDPADHLWAREVGARALLAKPLDPDEALTTLTALLAPRPG